MNKNEALRFRTHALSAIKELISIAQLPLGWESDEDLRKLRRGVGLAIGQIDHDILNPIYRRFPEIDDLRDMDLSQFDALFKDQA